MWGGRFTAGPGEIMQEINASIDFDRRLYKEDILGSKVHAAMLADRGIISKKDADEIIGGLIKVQSEIERGDFRFARELEDIHMHIEARLGELIGPAAGRLHTARSRNDQIAVDFRMFVRSTVDELDAGLARLQLALARKASAHAASVMPGFTHLQAAQPVTFGHHCLAYVEMVGRDRGRFRDARARMNECPLGAAALAGTSFAIDRTRTARELGFVPHAQLARCGFRSRLCPRNPRGVRHLRDPPVAPRRGDCPVVVGPVPLVALSDAFTTGSSIMPQKRNPDAAELVRAKAGRIAGALVSLLVVLKGLPLAYAKDMQEDKEPAFDAFHSLSLAIAATAGMIDDLAPNVEAMRAAALTGHATATDLADWLVRVLKLPFREAHRLTGSIVALAERKGVALDGLELEDLQGIESRITGAVFSVLTPEASVASRRSFGGTAPANVRREAARWLKLLARGPAAHRSSRRKPS